MVFRSHLGPSLLRFSTEHFLQKKPVCEINENHSRVLGGGAIAVNSGTYTFTVADGSIVKARYTFVYEKVNGVWSIVEHHSSELPN